MFNCLMITVLGFINLGLYAKRKEFNDLKIPF